MRRILRQHHDPGADIDAAEQVGDVFIGQADAARGNELADGRGIVGAVNAVFAGAKIHRARAERVAGTAGHETRQIRLARDHLRRRMPIRPFRLAADGLHAGPGKTFAADADAVANGAALAEHVIERGVAGIDDDGAGRFAGIERHDGPPQPLGEHAGVAVVCQRGLVRRHHDVVRRECALRRGGVAERLGARLTGENDRRHQQCPGENKRVGHARRWPAIACDCLCHDLPRCDAHHADASDRANAAEAPRFHRAEMPK